VRSSAAEANERIGPYQVVGPIGAGGSARIDLARIERAYQFQRHVVIKRPLEHLRRSPQVAASLRREVRIGGMLRHPNLVAVLDAGTHEDYDYLVLEYVHGATLRTLMQTDQLAEVRALPVPLALELALELAHGLHAAHELVDDDGAALGLIHRDVSPANVLLGCDGAVKLADFGLAKETGQQTITGSLQGTVTYMAPEQCRGEALDRRTDVFSLGVILHELLTGRRLFWADNDVASLHRVLSGSVERPRRLQPGLPAALDEIVMTALSPTPAGRFATSRAFADAIECLAAEAGYALGPRLVSRALDELLGAQPEPWIDADTHVDRPGPEEALIAAIEAAAAEPAMQPPLPTFRRDRRTTDVVTARASRARRRRRIGLAALALATGALAAAPLVINYARRGEPAPVVPAPSAVAPASVPASVPASLTEDRRPIAPPRDPAIASAPAAEPSARSAPREDDVAKPSPAIAPPRAAPVTRNAAPHRRAPAAAAVQPDAPRAATEPAPAPGSASAPEAPPSPAPSPRWTPDQIFPK
jgi:serine/threonine protein kinase